MWPGRSSASSGLPIHTRDAAGFLDLVEVNPVLDIQNATAVLAAELAASAFGMGIL